MITDSSLLLRPMEKEDQKTALQQQQEQEPEELVEETADIAETGAEEDSQGTNRSESTCPEAAPTFANTESNVIAPSNNTSTVDDLLSHLASFSHPPPFEFRIRKRDIFICHIILVVTSLITAVMNAAITIFGMGVGVGLILGDAIRGDSVGVHMMTSATTASIQGSSPSEDRIVMVRPATPHCRAAIRRIHAPRNERREIAADSVLPAQ